MKIKCIHKGQYRPYGDSYYEYDLYGTVEEVEEYVRKKGLPTKEGFKNIKTAGDYYRGYMELIKTGENKYHYTEVKPFTD